ncbi:hypothetical protein ZOD2009_15716 [Haladaptatus paucihalophilus DX253]|uniref:DUF1214 domain-containing protein n=1 Tax=Haladaptatus paucihalophilus DX253 TaxID=797209 RepID=E7QWF5_HALPU|nr:hypothetical protein ZOD2009_15716 [Haladaptatus paucihalophilus DX253]SHL38726.1 hypothetical protein SAMN05444342_3740 [Haladaptatus paucihalophilus DX253]
MWQFALYRRSRPSASGLDPEAVHVKHEKPDTPEKVQNWLPAPDGGMRFAARFYGPHWSLVDGPYDMPEVVLAEE